MDRPNCVTRNGLHWPLLAVVLLGGAPSVAFGQEVRREAGEYDFYFFVRYVDGLREEFQGSTVVEADSDYGFGFGLDYSYNGRWSIGGTIGYVEQDYAGGIPGGATRVMCFRTRRRSTSSTTVSAQDCVGTSLTDYSSI